jgi:hypothetical protein
MANDGESENAHNYFPTYEPTSERLEAIDESLKEDPIEVHYDARKDMRERGAGQYTFSGDEEQRRKEREELDRRHAETLAERGRAGAVDVKPGEVEGMRAEEEHDQGSSSRAVDKRKREREARMEAIRAKRQKAGKTMASTSAEQNERQQSINEAADALLADVKASLNQQQSKIRPPSV